MKRWNRSLKLDTLSWNEAPPVLDDPASLVLVFGASEHPRLAEGLADIVRRFPEAVIVGCSSSGEVAGNQVNDASLSVAGVHFEDTRVQLVSRTVDERGSHTLGRALADDLDKQDLKAVFVLSDGLNVNGSELASGLNAGLSPDVVVTGGLAGDGPRFGSTWVLVDGSPTERTVVAVGFSGERLEVGHGSQGGWTAFGPVRTVTRSEANVLFELDGRPALDLYKQYLGDKAADLPSSGLLFPLALRDPADPGKVLVRTLLSIDEDARSMTFAGDVPQGHTVQLMNASFDRLIDGAAQAARSARLDGTDTLTIAVSCVGRRLVLGERAEEELDAVLEELEHTTLTGFYSYGELSPFGRGRCDLHNQTMTLTVLREREAEVEGGMELARLSVDLRKNQWDARIPAHLDSDRTLVMVYGAPRLLDDTAPFDRLRRAFPQSQLVGCSTAGEIHGSIVRDDSLAITVLKFQRTALRSAEQTIDDPSTSHAVGRNLAERLQRPDLRAVFVLSDGLKVNGSELVRGIDEQVGSDVVVTGGLAGDGTDFASTWVASHAGLHPGKVVAIGFYGDHVLVQHGSLGGWDAFGPTRTVTKSDGNVLHAIDGKPALDLYKQYLGDKAADLPASGLLFPLAVTSPDAPDRTLVRTLLAVDEDARTMTFAGDIPEGHQVQLMKAGFERLVDGATGAALAAKLDDSLLDGSSSLAIAVSCVGRRLVLGERTEEEVDAILQALPAIDHLTGFYSYGELSPAKDGGRCQLHNQTMTLTTLAESAKPVKRQQMVTERVQMPIGSPAPLPGHLDSDRTLVVAFGSTELTADAPLVEHLTRSFPRSVVVGCSTSGEIHGTSVQDGTLSIAVTRFAKTALRSASVDIADASTSFAAGQQLARELVAPDLRAVFVLSDGLDVNGSELVRGLNATVDTGVLVTGGLAGDGTRFERTWVLADGRLSSGRIVAVGMYGDHLRVHHGSMGGWDAFGPVRTVTRSEGNVLFELDGRPALQLYKQYLGDKAADLPSSGLLFPLALRAPGEDRTLVRTLLAIDEEAQSLTFAGDVPEGHTVQLMKADFERLVDGASEAARLARSSDRPSLALAISCVGRRLVLGERIEEEVEAVQETLGAQANIVGFYSYGELSPTGASETCALHNQTMTLTVLHEVDQPLPRSTPELDTVVEPAPQVRAPQPVAEPLPEPEPEPEPVATSPESVSASAEPFPVDVSAFDASPEIDVGFSFDAFDFEDDGPTTVERPRRKETSLPRPAPVARPTQKRALQPREGLSCDTRRVGDFTVVSMAGRMSEGFKGGDIGKRLVGRVLFDLHSVERITSFGVRGWLDMLREMDADELYFARCSEAVINQVTMIRNFCGRGRVVSFFAPYACPSCGHEFTALYDAIDDRRTIDAHNPVDVACPSCGKSTSFDDDPWSYFALGNHLLDERTAELDTVLGRLIPIGIEGEPIQKEIVDGRTVVSLNTRIDEELRLRRVFEGLEGAIEFDLTGVTGTSPAGVRAFVSGLRRTAGSVDSIQLDGCPEAVLDVLTRGELPPGTTVRSAMVAGVCPDNGNSRAVLVDLRAHRAAILASTPLVLPCDWCPSDLDLAGVQPLLARCLATPSTPRAIETVPVGPPAPSGGVSKLNLALTGLLGTGLLTVAAAAVLVSVVALSRSAPAEPAVSAPVQPVDVVTETRTGWQDGSLLPPGWAEQPFRTSPDRVAAVGRGTHETVEGAADQARQDALLRLLDELQNELRGTRTHDLLSQAGIDVRSVDRDRALAAFMTASGGSPERARTAIHNDEGGGFTVVAEYTMPREAWDNLVETYGQTAVFRGLTVAPVFPTMSAKLGSNAELFVLETARWIQSANPGDVVVSTRGQSVHSLSSFEKLTTEGWRRLAPGSSLTIEVAANGLSRPVTFRKPRPTPK